MGWDETKYQSSKEMTYKIGYIMNCQDIQTCPAIRNGLQQTINIFKELGHEVVEFPLPRPNILEEFRNFTFQYFKVSGAINSIFLNLGTEKPILQNEILEKHASFGRIGSKYFSLKCNNQLEKEIYQRMDIGSEMTDLFSLLQKKE